MPYLLNTWYVAAWDSEVRSGEVLSRHLLDEPVVFFRNRSGKVNALYGVCPHRMALLARGKVTDDAVQCGYHGLQFDGSGACVRSPFGVPPRNLTIRSYPVVERHSLVWIWMGDEDKADPDLVPEMSFQDPETAYVGKQYLHVNASYELEIENILDLSHIEFLHPTTLGSGQVSTGKYECRQDGDIIWSNRDIVDELLSNELNARMGIVPGTHVDRWIHVKWEAPANMVILAGAVPTGRAASEGLEIPMAHLFTPETHRTSHYWFSAAFPKSVGLQAERMAWDQVEFLRGPFETEDLPMLEEQQAVIGDREFRSLKLAWLPGDAAGARARSVLTGKIEAEQMVERAIA